MRCELMSITNTDFYSAQRAPRALYKRPELILTSTSTFLWSGMPTPISCIVSLVLITCHKIEVWVEEFNERQRQGTYTTEATDQVYDSSFACACREKRNRNAIKCEYVQIVCLKIKFPARLAALFFVRSFRLSSSFLSGQSLHKELMFLVRVSVTGWRTANKLSTVEPTLRYCCYKLTHFTQNLKM